MNELSENLSRKPLEVKANLERLLFCVGLTPREIAERKAELAKFRHDCREMVIKYSLLKLYKVPRYVGFCTTYGTLCDVLESVQKSLVEHEGMYGVRCRVHFTVVVE